MWNCLDLKCPSSDLVEYQPQESFLLEKLRDFPTVLMTCSNSLISDHPIWKELSVLQNIQAKYKRILRCDKCLFYLQRVSHCLKKLVLLNLSRSYVDLADRFLIGFNTGCLPSRQQVEFVLIRTKASAKLVCEGIQYSRETFCFLIQKLKIGHVLLDLVMATSVTARLNIMLKSILVQLCDMYQKVLSWRYKLKAGEFKWTQKVDFPVDLEQWLESSTYELNKSCPMSKADSKFLTDILKIKIGNTERDANYVTVSDTDDDADCIIVDTKNGTDYGEVIPREEDAGKVNPVLTFEQNLFLKEILSVPSFEKLEDVWNSINKLDHNPLPVNLTIKKKRIISRFLTRTKEKFLLTKCKSNKKLRTGLHIAASALAKHLGFTQNQINSTKSDLNDCMVLPQTDVKLEPVSKMKELRDLYRYLCEKLLRAKAVNKYRKVQEYFKRQRADIKLLKQTKQNKASKKLVLCTSTVMLTLCKKYI